MPQRDMIHHAVKQALVSDRWHITDDPYVIVFGERFLFVDLGAEAVQPSEPVTGNFIGAERDGVRIADVEREEV